MTANVVTPDVVWRGGTANSELVALRGVTICGFFIPSGFAGTTLKIDVAYNRSMAPVRMTDSAGADVSYAVAANTYLRVAPADFAGVLDFRLVSSASEGANTVVKAAVREIV